MSRELSSEHQREHRPLTKNHITPFLLVGGEQSRMGELLNIPKTLLPIDGVPLLHHVVQKLDRAGMGSDILFGVREHADRIQQDIQKHFSHAEGFRFSHDTLQHAGTGGAFLEAGKIFLYETDQEAMLCMNGDTIVQVDLDNTLYHHNVSRYDAGTEIATMVLTTTGTHNVDQIHVDRVTTEIMAWNEGIPDAPRHESETIVSASNTGVSIIDRGIVERIVQDFTESYGKISFEKQILRAEVRYGKIFADIGAYPMININNPADIERLQKEHDAWASFLRS